MPGAPPEVRIESLEAGAAAAEGVVVVIDVFRAFTTAAIALRRGARQITMVGDIDAALALRRQGLADLCLGERHAARPPGFDFGNSPAALVGLDLSGKRLALTTSNGTRGLVAARRAQRLYAAALVNAEATVSAVLAALPRLVTLVAIGGRAGRTVEDELCALYLRNRLLGLQADPESVVEAILRLSTPIPEALAVNGDYPPEDRRLALAVDSVPIAIRLERDGDKFVTVA
jgi:2-phosphosulfolactate phosphatase